LSKYIALVNEVKRLEQKQASRKGSSRRGDPLVLASIYSIGKRKFANLRPGGQWSESDQAEFVAAWARMPPLTERERKFMANWSTTPADQLMTILTQRLAGIVPTPHGRLIPEPPLLDPAPARSHAPEQRTPAPVEQPSVVIGKGAQATPDSDRLKDYRDHFDLSFFSNY
jgi:hypothetical protein